MPYESLQVLAAPVVGIGGLAVKLWYDLKRTKERSESTESLLKQHVEACNKRHEEATELKSTVENNVNVIGEIRRTQLWMGDCMVGMAAKMDVSIPERPK